MRNKALLKLFLSDIIVLYYKYHDNTWKSFDILEEIDELTDDSDIIQFTINILKKIDISKMTNFDDFNFEIIRKSYQIDCHVLLDSDDAFLLIIQDWLNIQKRFINELRS